MSCNSLSAKTPEIEPLACPNEATAEVPDTPRIPDSAGLVAPVTTDEKAKVASYLSWLSIYGNDAEEKTKRLRAIKAWCEDR